MGDLFCVVPVYGDSDELARTGIRARFNRNQNLWAHDWINPHTLSVSNAPSGSVAGQKKVTVILTRYAEVRPSGGDPFLTEALLGMGLELLGLPSIAFGPGTECDIVKTPPAPWAQYP